MVPIGEPVIRRRSRQTAASVRQNRRLFLESLEDRALLAAVVTDKPDYAPAETALISATGYQLGETVKFQVLHIDGTPNTGGGHDPWNVQDGGSGDLDGAVNGSIKTSWYVNPDDSLGSVFELSALGLSSGNDAVYNFTDAGPPSVDQLFQWDPPGWVTGNNDGPYFEGDTVPYYTSLSNLVVGNTYSLTIEWDTTKDSKHAIDYLRSYDATIAFPPAVDPAVQAGVNVVTTDTIPIPEDTFMTSRPNFNGVQQPGVFKIYNGDLTGVSPYTTPAAYVGDTSTSITVTFVAQDDGVGDATTRIVLTWGGHIATRQDWGQLFSAVDIPGSPYHMRLEEFFDETNEDDLNVGNTDRSLSAAAVVFPATITVIKDAVPNDPQDFPFTTTGTGLANFSLDDDGDNTNTLSNTQVFSVTSFGTKTITESIVSGWDLTNIQIAESGGASDSTFNIANRLATLNVQEGENITVTFTNTKQSSITVVKDAVPNDLADFSFTSTIAGGANFQLDDDAGVGGGDNTLLNSILFLNPNPGTYVVTESALAGWDLTNLVINDPDNGSSVDLVARTATIDMDAGESITVTFTNTKRGQIIVEKQTNPDGSVETFEFDSNYGANFFLADGQQNNSGLLAPGSYTVQELAEAGWDLTSIQIVSGDTDAGSTTNLGTATATIDLDAGEVITVRFTNTQRGQIIVEKQTNPDGSVETFEFDSNYGTNFFLADGQQNNSGLLAPGSYTVQELAEAGWDLSNIQIVSGDTDAGSTTNLGTATATIDLDAGEVITVRFSNTQQSGITVVKDAVPNDLADFSFTSTIPGGANFQLDDDSGVGGGDSTLLNSINFNNLAPGSYTVTEAALAGWDLTQLVINDPDNGSSVNLATGTATIDLDAGEAITVTFTNTKRGQIIVEKQTNPDGSIETFEFDASYAANFFLADGQQNNSGFLVPGSYSVQELAEAGWDLTSIQIVSGDTDAGSTTNLGTASATIDLDAGEVITVRFTNTQRATVLVVKNTIGGDGTFEFDVSGTLNGQGSPAVPDPLSITTVAGSGQSPLFTFSNLPAGGSSLGFDEIVQAGWTLSGLQIAGGDADDTTAGATASLNVEPGETIVVTYSNSLLVQDPPPGVLVIAPDKTNASLPYVHVVDAVTGEIATRILAYEESYRGGVRVATGDVTGDGIAEIIVAPGRGHIPNIKIFDQAGNLLKEFLAFSSSFVGGVDIAVGDVDGDGWNDIAVAQNYNGNQVTVFRNAQNPTPTFTKFKNSFYPFGSSYKGGASVELADMGTPTGSSQLDSTQPDGKAELIIGSETGKAPTVQVRGYFGSATTPTVMRTFFPFTPTFRGGMSLDVAPVGLNDLVPDIIVGAGNGGASQVQILDGVTGAVLLNFLAFTSGDTPSYNAPLDVAAVDNDGNGFAEAILVAQGSDGTANEIRKFDSQSGALLSSLSESAFDSIFQGNPINDYFGAYFVAPLVNTPLPVVEVQMASTSLTASLLPYGPTYFGGVRVATGDINGDGIEEIVTGPERNHAPWVRIFDQSGNMLHQFLAYSSTYKGGVDVALGDINGDGKLDIATSMLYGGNQVRTFKNVIPVGAAILPKTSFSAYGKTLKPFGDSFKGGAVVELVDMGKPITVGGVKKLDSTQLDGKAEIVVANGAGLRSTVKAYSYFGANVSTTTAAALVRTFLPLNSTFRGGLSLDVGDVNGDLVPDVIVGAGRGGASQVQVLSGATGSVLSSFQAFDASEFNYNAKLEVEAQDTDLDGIVDFLLAAHDFDGKSREIRRFQPLTGELVDAFFQDYSKV